MFYKTQDIVYKFNFLSKLRKLFSFKKRPKSNFFLKKYRTDFEVIISNKFPNKFSYYMHPFQKKILLNQFKNMENEHLSRIKKSETYYKNLKDINGLSFPQIKFTKENIFLDFPILCTSKNIKKSLFNLAILNKKLAICNIS